MKKLLGIFVLSLTILFAALVKPAEAATYRYYALNRYDVFLSKNHKVRSSNPRKNVGVYQYAQSPDGRSGTIIITQDVVINNRVVFMYTPIGYYIPANQMRNGGQVKFYRTPPCKSYQLLKVAKPGKNLIGTGKVWFSKYGTRFGNMVKIDSLGRSGIYFKYR